jgi:hypothetical protein
MMKRENYKGGTVVELPSLDSPAITVRELLRYHKEGIYNAYLRSTEQMDQSGGRLHYCGYEFTFTKAEIMQFLAEDSMEQ